MGRLFGLLDSRLLSRIGNAEILVRISFLGLGLVGGTVLAGAGVVDVVGWVPVACFGVWTVTSLLLAIAAIVRRQPSTVASPFAQLVIAKGLARSEATLLSALVEAESKGREIVAEAAILVPVNNQRAALELTQSFRALEAEVASLVRSTDRLDDRWELLWSHKATWWDDSALDYPWTRARLDDAVKHMAWRIRQLDLMIEFLRDGDDEKVRHIRSWVAAAEKRAAEGGPLNA